MANPHIQVFYACELTDDGRYIRLHDKPMRFSEILLWLVKQGLVTRRPNPDGGHPVYDGWGDRYHARMERECDPPALW
jgi:hypothetical protein